MGYHPRIETPDYSSFITARSRNSELWFIDNPPLQQAILGYAAKFAKRYSVKLYGLALEGNHIQSAALFPLCNRASFMRDFNSCVARAVDRLTAEYPGGSFWGRRYSAEFLLTPEDIENWFFYLVLQAVQDGLVERISDYPGYNCFHDAIWGIERKFKVVRWAEYNAAKRYNPKVPIKNYTDIVKLKYERLPGYEHLSQEEYAKLMLQKLEQRRMEVVAKRKAQGLGFAGREALQKIPRGAVPHKTKTSTREDARPRILSVCPKVRSFGNEWYFSKYVQYKEASLRYRAGELDVKFPEGMYLPPAVTRAIAPPG